MNKFIYLFIFILMISLSSSAIYTTNVSVLETTNSADIHEMGFRITPNRALTINNITLYPSDTSTTCYIRNDSNYDLTSASTSSRVATFNYVVTSGVPYRIVCGSGGSHTFGYNLASFTSINDTALNITDQIYWLSVDNGDTRSVFSITASDYSIGGNLITTLVSPTNNAVYSTRNVSFNASFTPSILNLTNATLYLYNTTYGIVYNKTNIVTGNSTNSTNFTAVNLNLGHYHWNVLACGTNSTSVYCGTASSNNSFIVGATVSNNQYINTSYETSREDFNVTIDLTAGATLTLATLVYDGTSYTVSDITQNSSSYLLKRTIDINKLNDSSTSQLKPFYWTFFYANSVLSSQNSSVYYQNVSKINMTICGSAPYDKPYINYTIKNESTGSNILGSIQTTFYYYLGDGTIKKNYSYSATADASATYGFCFTPSHLTVKTDQDVLISKTGYDPRTYYLSNSSLTNSTSLINVYLLSQAFGTKYDFTVYKDTSRLSNALIIINKYFVGEGVYKTLEIRETDVDGKFSDYFETNGQYIFYAIENGVNLGSVSKTLTCSSAPCEVQLQYSSSASDIWDGYLDTFAGSVNYNLSFDSNTSFVTLNYVDTTGLAQYVRLDVSKVNLNKTTFNICDTSLYSASGTISCNVSGYEGDFKATAYISRSPEKIIDFIYFVIGTLADNIGLVGLFVSFLVLCMVVVTLAYIDISAGIISIPFVLGALKIMNLLEVSWGVIVGIAVVCLWLGGKLRA